MDRCIPGFRTACHYLRLFPALLLFAGAAASAATTDSSHTLVMVVGAYHFVSKANLVNMQVDDPLSPSRQVQIKQVVNRLSAFRPT